MCHLANKYEDIVNLQDCMGILCRPPAQLVVIIIIIISGRYSQQVRVQQVIVEYVVWRARASDGWMDAETDAAHYVMCSACMRFLSSIFLLW